MAYELVRDDNYPDGFVILYHIHIYLITTSESICLSACLLYSTVDVHVSHSEGTFHTEKKRSFVKRICKRIWFWLELYYSNG